MCFFESEQLETCEKTTNGLNKPNEVKKIRSVQI